MKKDRSTFAKFLSPSRRAAVGIGVSLAAALALAGALSSCDLFTYKDPFPPEYYADNWIDAIGFDQFVGTVFPAPAAPAAPVTGSWDFEYRYDNWTANDGFIEFVAAAAPYDTATAVAAAGSETLPAGLPAAAPVYRLELVNLISGGDFDGAASGTWTVNSGAAFAYDGGSKINGVGSMFMSAPKGSYIQYVPDLPAAMTNPVENGREYHYSARILNEQVFKIIDVSENSQSAVINATVATIGGSFQCNGSDRYFRIMPPSDNESFDKVYLDDFRLTRSKGMRLRLWLCPGETKYDMLKGAYRFSVWAHLDPTVVPTVNPYDIDTFTVTMNAVGTAGNLTSTTATYASSAAATGWVNLSVNSDNGALIFDENILDQPVLEIVIDFNSTHSGRVLLAAPELRYGRSY